MPCGRAWIYRPGCLERGRMHVPGPRAVDHADFFLRVACAEPDIVFMPYLGVWDRYGRPVYAYDLVAYQEAVVIEGAEVIENSPVYGVACFDPCNVDGRGADFVRRLHYDVEQVTLGALVLDVPVRRPDDFDLEGNPDDGLVAALLPESPDLPEQVERRVRPLWFWEGIHAYEGGTIAWHEVEVVGNLFEDFGRLADWGLHLDLAEVLRRLRLPGSERWGSLRVGAADASASPVNHGHEP